MAARADTYVLQCTFGFQNLPRRIEKTDPKSGDPIFKNLWKNSGFRDFLKISCQKTGFLHFCADFKKVIHFWKPFHF